MDERNSGSRSRREFLAAGTAGALSALLGPASSDAAGAAVAHDAHDTAPVQPSAGGVQWLCTTQAVAWQSMRAGPLEPPAASMFEQHVFVRLDQTRQQIQGFGAAFSEKGWQALGVLPPAQRARALDALFLPGAGAGLTLCRTPIGANDISRGWYSYDEVDGDFALEHFSIDNDRDTLVPFIQAALQRQPALRLWASPWSPPTWMKSNRHYAMTPAWPGQPSNGIAAQQVGAEGHDYFVLEEKYLDAYARYFRRYVESYREQGIRIGMVMPQNEFNSAQPFPSCCWTPAGLRRFIPVLAREMGALGVEVFFGTLERGNVALLEQVLEDPACAAAIKGVGVQWAGKDALEALRVNHPGLPVWGSEQECGIGTNDWHYARYGWSTMRRYFLNNAAVWTYWNMVMPEGGFSGWGWPQNSLVVVDTKAGTFRHTPDYWLLRHFSQFVQPGAWRLQVDSYFGYENQLAFRNPDGSVVIVAHNDGASPLPVNFELGTRQLAVTLPADSFNTLLVPPSA